MERMIVEVSKRFFLIPVKKSIGETLLQIKDAAGTTLRYFKAGFGTREDCDFVTFYDVHEFLGMKLTLEGERLPQMVQSDVPVDAAQIYKEPFRPQAHFSSKRGWLNDPNGLYHYDGLWHLFYQHNHFSADWGTMHWGHAVSPDLLHWTERGVELYPDALGTMYSGSAVIDHENCSGLKEGLHPPIILYYTAAGDQAPVKTSYTQCMAYSVDGGLTWRKYVGNPLVGHIAGGNRDPKIVRHKESGKWIMALYLDGAKDDKSVGVYALLSSTDLKSWKEESRVEMPGHECPDFFELAFEGEPGRRKWVIFNACSDYLVGSFDGSKFIPGQAALKGYSGTPAYAPQSYFNSPDGRTIQFAWFRQKTPGMPFSQFMSLPLELSLRDCEGKAVLVKRPARELSSLDDGPCSKGTNLHVKMVFEADKAAAVDIKGLLVEWLPESGTLRCGANELHPHLSGSAILVEAFVDLASCEFFVNDGEFYAPVGFEPDAKDVEPKLLSGSLKSLDVLKMKSIWN